MPKVTVVMPSLNVRRFIRPCMESVLKQSLEDIEILAVDAGSTDGTLEILEEYAAGDDRLRIIYSDKRSYGHQVNLGIESARSEYIGIVETDDIIAADMYEILYRKAVEDDLEYVKCGFSCFVETDSGLRWYQKGGMCVADQSTVGKVISPASMPELAIQDYYLWAGIYRRSLLEDIRLSETPGAAFQDIGFIYQVLSRAVRAVYLDDDLYYYRQTRANSSSSKKGFRYLIDEYTNLSRFLSGKSDDWVHAYYARMFRQTVGRFERMAVNGEYWTEVEDDIKILQGKLKQAESEKQFSLERLSEDNRRTYYKLQENASAIFFDAYAALAPKMEKVQALLNNIGHKKTVIFGCGNYGKFTHVLLEYHIPGQMCAFCDNDESLWNIEVQGIKVVSPEEAAQTYPEAKYVTANLRGWSGIHQQLLKLGIKEEQIYRYQPDIDIRLLSV